jgi:hypothetical protein
MNPYQAYYKCREAYIKCDYKINKDLEKIIMKHPEYAYCYAREVIKGRWIEAENTISTSSWCSYCYARDVIKDRWIEAENIISTDSYWTYLYARNVIKGKLPENMHNAMILHADHHAKEYFDLIK